MERGQVSIEYVVIMGFLLLLIIPLTAYSFIEVKRSTQMNNAEDTVNTLANAADEVYALGPGSKKYVQITIPGGVTQSSVSNREVQFKMTIFGGTSDVFAPTKAELEGAIPTTSGPHRIYVEMQANGKVRFSIAEETTTCTGTCKVNDCSLYDDCSSASGDCGDPYHCCAGTCTIPSCDGICWWGSCSTLGTECSEDTDKQCENPSYKCCTGTCNIPVTCTAYCLPGSDCNAFGIGCILAEGECLGDAVCCTGNCEPSPITCSGYCMPLECTTYGAGCSEITEETCGGDAQCCTGICIGSGECCCEEWSTGVCEAPCDPTDELHQVRDCIPNGCNSESRCVAAQSHNHLACYDNDVYWYNECNSREDKSAECGTTSCGSWESTTAATECCDCWWWSCSGKKQRRLCTYRGCSAGSCFENTGYEYGGNCDDCPGWWGSCSGGVC